MPTYVSVAREFPQYYHSLDIWHKAKKLRKCLLQVLSHVHVLMQFVLYSHMIYINSVSLIHPHRHLRERGWEFLRCGVITLSLTSGGAVRVVQEMWTR